MGKIVALFVGLFIVALVLPEVRALLFVSGFCLVTGYMMGMQHRANYTAELLSHRAERVSMQTVEA